MPSVVIMFGASTVVLLAIFQYVITTSNLTNNVVYRQIAITAAHAALDYGKSQFDSDLNYSGTSAYTVVNNSQYRVTFDLVRQSVNGRFMRAQGIGKVYLPPTSTTPRYTRIVNGEIISSQISANNPSDFSPLAWYDASCNPSTSAEPDCAQPTVLTTGTVSAVGNPTSLREEQNNGAFCGGAPNTGDGNLAMTRTGECGSTNDQYIGMMFNLGSQLPKGVTITNAYIQFTAQNTNTTQLVTRIRGIKANNYPNFTNSASSQLNTAPLTLADPPGDYDGSSNDNAVTWNIASWSAGQSSTAQRTPDISSIIQEIIDQPGWATGNNVGFRIDWKNSGGVRKANHTPITLNITYSGSVAANNGNDVAVWRDRSGNGLHMAAPTNVQKPTKSTVSQYPSGTAPNGKPMLRFDLGDGMSTTVPASSGRVANTYTALAIMRVKNNTKTDGTGFIVSMYGSGTDYTVYSPFWRHPASGYHSWDSVYNNNNNICFTRDTYEQMCRAWNGDSPNTPGSINTGPNWTLVSMRESVTERDSLFRMNGDNDEFGQWGFAEDVKLNAPYYLAIAADASSVPGGLGGTADVEIAELIIYDRLLTCPQLEGVEQYMAQKWGFTDPTLPSYNKYTSGGCTENSFPTY